MLDRRMLYVPVFIFSVVELVQGIQEYLPIRALEKMGVYSVFMWFWHCMFFNVCKEYTQPVLYISQNPILVIIWGIVLCYALASLIDKIVHRHLSKCEV